MDHPHDFIMKGNAEYLLSVRATAAQLCARYQISRTTWWRWAKSPGFPKPVRFGRSVRWDPAAVEAFLTIQQ